MDFTKLKLNNIFLFLFLILFPFGQLIRPSINLFGFNVPVLPIDLVVGLAALYVIVKRSDLWKVPIFRHFKNFLIVSSFTFLVSVFAFKTRAAIYGLFYLVRLAAYFYFLIYVVNFIKEKSSNKKLLTDSLLGVTVASAVFGWIQYFKFPDIKPFFTYGWDEHLFRLVGTFLDSTFLGLIIVFGLAISITRFLKEKTKNYLFLTVFLIVSLAFTYSRASFLAFLAALLAIWYQTVKTKKTLFLAILMLLIVIFLPRPSGESVHLERTASIYARITNYKETVKIIRTSPLFGVGYNNLCLARQKYIAYESFSSHSCSGSDSSILFILATTGVAGLFSFLYLINKIASSLEAREESKILFVWGVALLTHSLFSNSLFYPFIMGIVIILVGISLRVRD